MNPRRIDVALVGCGHMGRHHARTIAAHAGSRLVAAVDIVPERAREVAAKTGAEPRSTIPDGVDVVVVATPTLTHGPIAGAHLAGGGWCFVEKPLAATLADAKVLDSPRLAVGHVERFNPAIRAAGPMRPQLIEARRFAPPTGRSLDVDVVLDLMIHDLDLVLSWCDGDVEWFDAKGVAVASPRIDTASVRLRTSSGATATLAASRVATAPERTMRVYEQGRHTILDLGAGRAVRDGVQLERPDGLDALSAQWDAFVRAVRGEHAPAVDFRAGCRAVELAEAIAAAVVARGEA